ncbi:MAG: T9SS type A sorting domain-containing protein [Thiohalospira sp.]
MKKKLFKMCITGVIIVLTTYNYSFSQETINSAGAGGMGSGGTIEYSLGQVLYLTNNSSDGIVIEGIQQPYEIFVLTSLPEGNEIDMHYSVFPNPTSSCLNLKVGHLRNRILSYKLFNMNGQLLMSNKITESVITIEMNNYTSGFYILKVEENHKEIKTFKIFKN